MSSGHCPRTVDDDALVVGHGQVFLRSEIGGKDNLITWNAQIFNDVKLSRRAAVHAATLLVQQLKDGRSGFTDATSSGWQLRRLSLMWASPVDDECRDDELRRYYLARKVDEDEEVEQSDENVKDRINFFVNNMSISNLEAKDPGGAQMLLPCVASKISRGEANFDAIELSYR
ncbi:hypothetical protein PsorP6_012284 [Peronosclerospora sorghi]|uniref:Uncharacterized protein n=1 Tax=Peronosclerospora sorghi TaxID=230839 RepID=A0ACC0WIZ9_9STRA|nr:hypothetical protein PsorP6_012284 [Peronosclerospora sorghi]